MAALREMNELVPDARLWHRWREVRGDTVLAQMEAHGVTPEGNAYEWLQYSVWQLAVGVWIRTEMFPGDNLPAARARFEELAVVRRTPAVDNAAVRTAVRWDWLRQHGEPGAADDLIAVSIAMTDRRRGVSMPAIIGRAAFNETMDATAAVFSELEIHPVAVRGEQLALVNMVRSNEGFELSTRVLIEADPETCMRLVTIFDEDDLAAALEEMETRHLAILGEAATAIDRMLAEGVVTLNRRDPDGYERFMVPDVSIVDHLPLNFPPAHRASDFTKMLRRLYELAPDTLFVAVKSFVSGRVSLQVQHQHSTTPEGNRYTWFRNTATQHGADGRIVRCEYFPEDRWDDALALFDDWSSESEELPSPAAQSPAELIASISAAFEARDWDWIRSRTAPGIQLEDRRSTVSSQAAFGVDAVIDLFRGFADVGFETLEQTPLATRGEGLVLLHRTYRSQGGFELEMLVVAEAADERLGGSIVLFDADHLVDALDELDRRYRQSRGSSLPTVEDRALAALSAFNHRAWNQLDALAGADVLTADDRRLGYPDGKGPWAVVGALQGLVEQVPDVVAVVEQVESTGSAAVARIRQRGASAVGAVAEWVWLFVLALDADGRFAHLEWFDPEDESQARARFAELSRG